jgi:hypothetical protein
MWFSILFDASFVKKFCTAYESARHTLKEAIQANPGNELARMNLARLDSAKESAGPSWMNFGIASIEPQPVAAQ